MPELVATVPAELLDFVERLRMLESSLQWREQVLANAVNRMSFTLTFFVSVLTIVTVIVGILTICFASKASKTVADEYWNKQGAKIVEKVSQDTLRNANEQMLKSIEQYDRMMKRRGGV